MAVTQQVVRFVDLSAQTRSLEPALSQAMTAVLDRGDFILGRDVELLEQEYAAYCGVAHAVGTDSGLSALELSLRAVNIGPGDEVVTQANTFIATVGAIMAVGARPILVDCDPHGMINPDAVCAVVMSRTRAIMPVHLFGLICDIEAITAIAARAGAKVIEDACQAHGARIHHDGQTQFAGTIGAAGCFSFYPGKNLGAWGEGGAVSTNDEELAAQIRTLRDHGRLSHHAHSAYGYNARLDTLQAAVLRPKLERLEEWNAQRRAMAALYRETLPEEGLTLLSEPEGSESCYHLFVIRSNRRDAIRTALLKNQIECGIHYPVPLHLQPACRDLGYAEGDFPHAEKFADSVLSLPMHPFLTEREVKSVSQAVKRALATG